MAAVRVLGTFLVALFMVAAPALASADAPPVATQVVLTSAESTISSTDGKQTVKFTVLNPTTADVAATLLAPDLSGCKPSVIDADVPAGRQATVSFSIDGCHIKEGTAVPMKLSVGSSPIDVVVKHESAKPVWSALWAFPIALLCALVLVLVGYGSFRGFRPGDLSEAKAGIRDTLPYLSATWSFKDSWAANVTLVSAVFTGLFGTSDLIKSITGSAQPSTLALVTVASAIAVAIVGAAPIVLQILRTNKGQVYVGGLLLSASLAVGAAGGLIWIIAGAADGALPDSADRAITIVTWLGLALLALYAVTSVRQNLALGLRKPAETDAQKQSTISVFIQSLGAQGVQFNDAQVRQSLEDSYPAISSHPAATSPGDSYPAALI